MLTIHYCSIPILLRSDFSAVHIVVLNVANIRFTVRTHHGSELTRMRKRTV